MRFTDSLGRWASCLALCALLPACSSVQPEARPRASEPTGSELYARHCGACHGIDGRGATPFAQLLRTPPADLTQIAARRGGQFSERVVREIVDGRSVAHGARDMPIWGHLLSDEEIMAITRHLRTMQRAKVISLR